MDSFVHFENCFFCGLIFKFGRHQYLGKFIPAYQIAVCDRCYNENPNGWDKDAQKKLLPYLTSKNLTIPAITKEFIPRNPPLDNSNMKIVTIKIDD